MKKVIRWGLAAGLAAALGLHFDAQAQSATGSSGSSGSASGGSRGDTGGPTPTGQDRSTAGRETTPQGGAAGTSSDSGSRSSSTAQPGASGATGSSASGTSDASGRQAQAGKSGQQGKIDKGLQERLERLHAMNQAEVQMGQLGAQNATSPEVKQFAEHMQTDHQKADQKLTQTAQTAGAASLEGKTYQKESDTAKKDMQKLQSKTGADFDKEFMSRMVKDHEKAIKEVEKAQKDAQKANHTELASLLQQTHTGMQGHLDHAKQVEKSLKDQGQRQGRRPSGATGSSGASGGTGAGAPGGTSSDKGSGSRGDTGGPTPGGKDRGSAGQETTPGGGAAGTSSDSGQRTTK